MIRHRFALILGLSLSWGPLASNARAEVGEELTVRVLTIGPGPHPFFHLGESAIWIQDERASRGVVYTFGTVKPDSLWSALAWLSGRLTNRMSRTPIDEALEAYRRGSRSVDDQQLDLPPAAREALRRELELAVLPENRDYRYDPFLNSGATRVRDAIDRAAGGRLRAAGAGSPADASRPAASGPTLRQQALHLTRDRFPAYLLVDLALGVSADRPLGQSEQIAIPSEVRDSIRRVGRAGSWNNLPLIASEGTIVAASPAPPHPGGPASASRLLLVGLILGTALALSGRAGRRWPALRGILAASTGLVGLLFGLLGIALVLGWLFGPPLVGSRNENILQLAPWAVVLPALAAGVAAGQPGVTRRAFLVTAAAAALSGVGLLLKATPWFQQENLRLIGLFLPIWTGLAFGLLALYRR